MFFAFLELNWFVSGMFVHCFAGKGAVLLSLYCCFYYYNYSSCHHYYKIIIIVVIIIIIIIIIIITIIIIIIIIIIFFCFERKFVKYRPFFFPCNSRNLPAFKWTKEHDVLLAREMLTAEP